jgi:cytochrome b561
MSTTRSHLTRILHLAVLLTVVDQLLTSLVMERPLPGEDADWPFALHQQVGVVGLGVLLLFWVWTLIRDRRETPLRRLLPWFSADGLAGLAADLRAVLRALAKGKAPPLHLDALAGAVHGLGVLVASFLALSGAAWLYLFTGTPYGRMALMAHKLAGNVMWAYLIAHALAALAHEARGDRIFARMFWVRRRRRKLTAPAE